jgi:peptidyl-dipeptidase A
LNGVVKALENKHQEISRLLQEINERLAGKYRKMMHSLWTVLTSGEMSWVQQLEEDEKAYQDELSSVSLRQTVGKLLSDGNGGLLHQRQLHVLSNEILEYKTSGELRQEVTSLWNELHYIISTYRTEHGNSSLSENDVLHVLQLEQDEMKRRELWTAYMGIGEKIAPGLIKLVRLRNRISRENGFDNYYVMKNMSQELDPGIIQQMIKEIRTALDPIYRREKEEIDRELAERFRISPADVRSWHYPHPFFQNYLSGDGLSYGIKSNRLLEQISAWFEARDYDLSNIFSQADLFERKNKSQANFCLNLNRGNEIRVSCNITPDQAGLTVFLHELGHAAYESGINGSLPFLLRQPAHTFVSEAIALLFERLASNLDWLNQQDGGISSPSDEEQENIQKRFKRNLLVKLYWTMALVEFERRMYEDPDGHLNDIWWAIVEEYQGIPRPEHWNYPYWASKAHLTTLPVYYHNYLLGEVAASQIEHSLEHQFGTWHSTRSLHYVREQIFRHGLARPWQEIIRSSCASELDPIYLIGTLKS